MLMECNYLSQYLLNIGMSPLWGIVEKKTQEA